MEQSTVHDCLLVRGVMCCRSNAISVQNRLKGVRSIQFAFLIASAAISVQFGARGPSASVQLVQFIAFSSAHGLFRPMLLIIKFFKMGTR